MQCRGTVFSRRAGSPGISRDGGIMKKFFQQAVSVFKQYKHIVPSILYMIVYLIWFEWLETHSSAEMQIIHMNADDYIPFCEIFIIPYLLWFVYVAGAILYFMLKDKEDYCKMCIFLFTGMTVFLVISTFWPNGHHLRPYVMPRDNVFTRMIGILWQVDTPTNLWPSIHVYNSLGVYFAFLRSRHFDNKKGVKIAAFILSASIIASTMFIKQHSVFDVTTAFVLAAIMYTVIYRHDLILSLRLQRGKKKAKSQMAGNDLN